MTDSKHTRIAIYDLDRTITSLPTWTPYLLFAGWRLGPARLLLLPTVSLGALARALGAIDRDQLKELMHSMLLGRAVPAKRLAAVSDAFADWIVGHHLRDGASAQIAVDRAEGRQIVIATAAHRYYAEPIARRLGVADLLATLAQRGPDGQILSRLDGLNCYGVAKHAMISRWFSQTGLNRQTTHIRFYSDHASDQPTFEWVDEPVAVNPHAPLRRLATERGWQIVDWRR